MTTPIQHRATELVGKGGMPWHEAENLALSEFGITDADVEELMGECCNTTILTGEDISALIRSVLVHGSALLARNSEDAMTSSAYIDGLERRTHEMKRKIDALDYELRVAKQPTVTEPSWPKERDIGRYGDMSPHAHIRVGFDSDNDVYVSVWDEKGGAGIEFCQPGAGGGKSSRTRVALIALMVAMEADNADTPALDWWARRNGAICAQTAAQSETEGKMLDVAKGSAV